MRVDSLPSELEDLWDDFRRSLARRNRSEGTLSVYRKSFEQFWRWAIGAGVAPDPTAVTHHVVNRWTDAMLTAPVVRNGQTVYVINEATGERVPRLLTPATRRIRFINLRPFFSWWAKEFDAENPMTRADVPGEDRPVPIPVVDLDDVRRLVGACRASLEEARKPTTSPAGRRRVEFEARRDEAIVRVLFDTGARLGELTSMNVDHFDGRHDNLTLRGKTGTRVVPISPSTGEALSRYLRVRKTHTHARRDAMWLSRKGPLSDSGVAQALDRLCTKAGVDHVNPHRFRHGWAHLFRAEGGSEGDLMYLAGWKSTAMAHRYGHSAAAERAQASARALHLGDRL